MRGGGFLSCSQVDKTDIRRRMTLQIQAETLGRADQKKKAERREAKYRSQDLSGGETKRRRRVPDPYPVSSYHTDSPVTTQGRRPPLFSTQLELRWDGSCDLVFWKQIHNERQLREGVKVAEGES